MVLRSDIADFERLQIGSSARVVRVLLGLQVGHQVVISSKAFVAQPADVGFLASVRLIMHLQYTGVSECLAAGVAGVGSLITMGATRQENT